MMPDSKALWWGGEVGRKSLYRKGDNLEYGGLDFGEKTENSEYRPVEGGRTEATRPRTNLQV